MMTVLSPCCRHSYHEMYCRIGTDSKCPVCERWFKLANSHVLERGDTGYQITFTDFKQLLRDHVSEEDANRYIAAPLGLRARLSGEGWVFFTPEPLGYYDSDVVHLWLQSNEEARERLYRYAMDRWR